MRTARVILLSVAAAWAMVGPSHAALLEDAEGYVLLVERLHPAPRETAHPKSAELSARKRIALVVPDEPRFAHEIERTARHYGIRPEFLTAIVECESNFNPQAMSPKGAIGLAQIMPATAVDMGIDPSRLYEPRINLTAAALYIRWLINTYGASIDRVLIGYNAGPLYIEGPRSALPLETRLYIKRVKASYRRHLFQSRRSP